MPDRPPTSVPSNCVPVGMMYWPRNCSCGVPLARSALASPAAARGAIDLAVGEDGHVALRVPSFVLPEDDAVDVAELGLQRVHELVRVLQVMLDRAAELDQARQL